MNDIFVGRAAALFDDIEKWSTFLDLHAGKEKLVDLWYAGLIDNLRQNLVVDQGKWQFRKWHARSWGWYADFDQDSLVVLYEHNRFCLWINDGKYDSQAILSRFRTQKLFVGFFATHNIRNGGPYMAIQENAIVIRNITNPDLLAWYAGHAGPEHEQMLNELHRFFSFYLHDPEIFNMVQQANTLKR